MNINNHLTKLQKTRVYTFLHKYKIYIYPAVLFILLISLASLRISGTSIGIYHTIMYGNGVKDSSLLFGKPQSIRSDEWLVTTQSTIAQERVDYSQVNQNYSQGEDMSLLLDAPYKDWSSIFKPQNFAFFVIPFENAFAFKWWFMLVILMIGAYFFCLRFLPGKIFIAITASVIVAFSPFVNWWYQTGTIASLAYGFLVILLSMSIIDNRNIFIFNKLLGKLLSNTLRIAALAYVLVCFALLLYPPFQISVALVVTFFMIGYLLKTSRDWRRLLMTLVPFAFAFILTGSAIGLYTLERMPIINTVSNTAYPGQRRTMSGEYHNRKTLFATYLQPLLQFENKGNDYGLNQSESSNFILSSIFFLLPSIFILTLVYLKTKKIEWVLAFIILCNVIFISFMFIPGIDVFTRFLGLSYVPTERLVIGLGFLAIINVVYILKVYQDYKTLISKKFYVVNSIYAIALLALMIWAGFKIGVQYPDFIIASGKKVFVLATILMTGVFLILINRPRIGMLIIALFSVASVIYINPLYIGLGPIYNSEVSKTIQTLSNKNENWGAAQNIVIENVPQMSGRPAVTGVSSYPNIKFWQANSDSGENVIYNRYAHIILSSDDSSSLKLLAPDFFVASSGCERKISKQIDYIVSATTLPGVCDHLVKTLTYPNMSFYFYRVSHN